MSESNVELVSSLMPEPDVDLVELFCDEEAWANLNETLGGIWHDDAEVVFIGLGQDSRHHGPDALRDLWVEWLEPWETYRAEISRVIDCGDDVLVITDDYGRKPGMTAEVRLFGAAVWTVREGRVVKARFYANRQDALNDVGLDAAILDGE